MRPGRGKHLLIVCLFLWSDRVTFGFGPITHRKNWMVVVQIRAWPSKVSFWWDFDCLSWCTLLPSCQYGTPDIPQSPSSISASNNKGPRLQHTYLGTSGSAFARKQCYPKSCLSLVSVISLCSRLETKRFSVFLYHLNIENVSSSVLYSNTHLLGGVLIVRRHRYCALLPILVFINETDGRRQGWGQTSQAT